MKYFIVILIIVTIGISGRSQSPNYPFYQLYQLDSIGKTQSISRHFGELYYSFLLLVEKQLEKTDTATQRLVRHFEMVFAQFYIDACVAYKNNEPVHLPEWRAYFADTTLQSVQYKLLGANAHLNGGLAEAIAGSYTPDEWAQVKKKYFLFNTCLNKTYHRYIRKRLLKINGRKLWTFLHLAWIKYLGNIIYTNGESGKCG